jgi:glucokinase
MSKRYIGIDLGGTKIAAGVTDENGRILATAQSATLSSRPYQEVVRDMAACALRAMEEAGCAADAVEAIGIGIPGLAENKTGSVIFCTNLGWHNVPLRQELTQYLNKPIYIDNDATVAGFAESVAGVSQGADCSVFITLGTGVGGGIVIGGKPWTGVHGVASEIGHLTMVIDGIPCTCGKSGCVERYCSATALVRMGQEAALKHPDSQIAILSNQDPANITGKLVIDCAKAGDATALEVFNEYTRYLALAINNVISFLDPEIVVLGGGISNAGDFLLDAVRRWIPGFLMFKTMPYPRVELAVLGNQAGIIGAAMLAKSIKEEGEAYARD